MTSLLRTTLTALTLVSTNCVDIDPTLTQPVTLSQSSPAPAESSTTHAPTTSLDSTFIDQQQDFFQGDDCDPFNQDCPPGEKCTWFATDGGGAWNATKCEPIAESPAGLGALCYVVGNATTGLDDCDLGLICWEVDDENFGHCAALCTGSPEMPTCASGSLCRVYGSGMSICFETCDPVSGSCENPGDLCLLDSGYFFTCIPGAEDLHGIHESCMFANACEPGLVCLVSRAAAECDQAVDGCCEPFCDAELPNTCPGLGQECVPFFELGTAPPGFEYVGACARP